jgi:hypothetical protein
MVARQKTLHAVLPTIFFHLCDKFPKTVIGLLKVGDIKVFINMRKYLLYLFVEF